MGQVAAQPVVSAVVWVPKVSLSVTSLWSLQKVLVGPATTGAPTKSSPLAAPSSSELANDIQSASFAGTA